MKVKFLGTAGARYVMATQLRSSAGIYMEVNGKKIIFDPGPGTLVRMAHSRPKLNPFSLNAVVLSHLHLDHTGDVNAILDAMTEGAKRKRGFLFAPAQCIKGEDKVVLPYLINSVNVVELKEKTDYEVDGLKLQTSIAHDHGVETYGIKIPFSDGKVCFMVDTRFSEKLLKSYGDCTYFVVNVVLKECRKHIKHICLEDVKKIALTLKPRGIIMTHFGMGMLRARPWELAEELSKQTGVDIKAASDGMVVEI